MPLHGLRIRQYPFLPLGCALPLLLLLLLQIIQKSASFGVVPIVVTAIRRDHPRRRRYLWASPAASSQETPKDNADSSERDRTYQTNLEISSLATKGTAESALAAHELLRQLPQPDTVTYNGVLKAYAKSNLPQPALELLQHMERLGEDESSMVRPNVISYSTVMDAFCRQQKPSVARKLLARLVERYERTQEERFRPNSVVYNCLLAAYAKSGRGAEAVDLSLQLLHKMGDLADVISYNTVLHAIAKSGAPDAGERAQALIDKMHVAPNARTYSTAMDCWARSSHDDRATIVHDLLRQMEHCYSATGDDTMRPNVVSYSAAIHSYANSKDPHKAERAYEILKHMWVEPTLVTYNSVLNCCAASSSTDSKRIQEIVDFVYQSILNSDQRPDEFTYGTMLKACANVFMSDPETPQRVQRIFKDACQAGCVSFGVCYQFKQAAPAEIFRAMLPERAVKAHNLQFDVQKFPKEWTRNVKDRGGPRKTGWST
jgi:pentatricopeptide repeat protein